MHRQVEEDCICDRRSGLQKPDRHIQGKSSRLKLRLKQGLLSQLLLASTCRSGMWTSRRRPDHHNQDNPSLQLDEPWF